MSSERQIWDGFCLRENDVVASVGGRGGAADEFGNIDTYGKPRTNTYGRKPPEELDVFVCFPASCTAYLVLLTMFLLFATCTETPQSSGGDSGGLRPISSTELSSFCFRINTQNVGVIMICPFLFLCFDMFSCHRRARDPGNLT